jgi:hypothetical protein
VRNSHAVLAALLLGLACSQGEPKAQGRARFAETEAQTDTRLNAYFREKVATPALRQCWSQLAGKGWVGVELRYRKTGADWSFDAAQALDSAGPNSRAAAACLTDAARGTAFPVAAQNETENAADALFVRWGWEMPLPRSAEEVAAMIISEPGGPSEPVICEDCVLKDSVYRCERKKRGYPDCRTDPSQPNVCSTESTACASGVFGMSAGAVMY